MAEHVKNGSPFILAEVEDNFTVVVICHSAGKVHYVATFAELCKFSYIVVEYIRIFIELCLENLIGCRDVSQGRVCLHVQSFHVDAFFKVFVAIVFVGGNKGARFKFVIDILHVNKFALAQVKVYSNTVELLYKHGHIKFVGVEACKVTSLKKLLHAVCHLSECRHVFHVVISYVMHGSCFWRNRHFRVQPAAFAFLFAVRVYLRTADFNYTVVQYVGASGFEVEEYDGFLKVQFH